MWTYYPDLLATPVPRYTSYPTAAEFGSIEGALYAQVLEGASGDVSLYVHIPFCEKICFYCGCNTAAANRRQRLDSYLLALQQEIKLVSARLPKGTRVRRLSFGGGSPNALAPVDFVRLVDSLYVAFQLSDPVISIELDPRSLTSEWVKTIGGIGIERASLGVQTFAPHCQQSIGRVQGEDVILRSVDWLRGAGIASLNFDLMYGLPGQSLQDLEDSLQRTRVLGADRIALFGYAHVPHLVPRQKAIPDDNLPDQELRFRMAEMGYSYLLTHGYAPVGFDHFARPGDPLASAALAGKVHRNFQGFTDDAARVLVGLGASAISSFPQLLAQNVKEAGRYRMMTSGGVLPVNRGIVRSADDRYRGAVIEQLLCTGSARVGARLLGEVSGALQPFIDREVASMDDDHVSILPVGLPYARTIAALFDPWRQQSARRFSSAV
ncbi:MAG: oxygen-independent coproporphyrinogen III oxidase [Novosphingobium sp.]